MKGHFGNSKSLPDFCHTFALTPLTCMSTVFFIFIFFRNIVIFIFIRFSRVLLHLLDLSS